MRSHIARDQANRCDDYRCIFLLSIYRVEAQQAGKVARIGVLRIGSPPDPLIDNFHDGLKKLGYVEGRNIVLELRREESRLQTRLSASRD